MKGEIEMLLFTSLFVVVLAGWSVAQQQPSPAARAAASANDGGPPPLVGAWRLTSFVVPDSSGQMQPWWDDQPSGLIIYTADGHMSAQLYDARRPRVGVRWDSAGAEEARIQYAGLITYFGTYTLDTSAHTVTHTVEGAMAPDWIGQKLVRGYRFINPNEIELRVLTDENGRNRSDGPVLIWQRVTAVQPSTERN